MKKFTIALFLFFTILIQDSSAQWTNVSTGLDNKEVYSFTNNSTNLFAGTFNYGLYTSTNNGMNWSQAGIGLNKKIPNKNKVYDEFKLRYKERDKKFYDETIQELKEFSFHYSKLINPSET